MIRILVTAFGAFPGAPVNPTTAIAAALRKRSRRFALSGIEIETRALPVVFAGVRERLATMIAQTRPDIVVHLGLAARRRTISVETRALNRLTILHGDAERRLSGSIHVEKGGKGLRRARYPAARLARAMTAAGAPTRLSIDAGDYLCNQSLYHSLSLHGGLCGFIHVPKPRILRRPRRMRHAPVSRPSLEEMVQAVAAGLRLLATAARTARRTGADPT